MMAQEKRRTDLGSSFLDESGKKANIKISFQGKMRVSNDHKMAIEDGADKRQSKIFYALPEIVNSSNKILEEIGSPIRLAINPSISITLVKLGGVDGGYNTLCLIYPIVRSLIL